MMTKIPVIEIFGATIQGEGELIGAKTMFVRTGGCDYSCSWCDSKFTWDGSVKPIMMTPEQIFKELELKGKDNYDLVTISGGNPALISSQMQEFINILKVKGKKVALETQGSKHRDWFNDVDYLTLSPKPPSSKMETDYSKLDQIISDIKSEQLNIKVVVFDDIDYDYAKSIHKRYPKVKMSVQVGNSDVVTTENNTAALLDKLDWLIEKVINDKEMNKVRALPQLHTLLWGNKRGV